MISREKKISGRFLFVQFAFLIAFFFLLLRLFYIQIYEDKFIKDKVDSRTIYKDYLHAKRGKILDRNERVLALDITGYSLEADLSIFFPKTSELVSLARIL